MTVNDPTNMPAFHAPIVSKSVKNAMANDQMWFLNHGIPTREHDAIHYEICSFERSSLASLVFQTTTAKTLKVSIKQPVSQHTPS